jgi:mRNA interferase YafQ
MKHRPRYSTRIKKQLKLSQKRGYDTQLFKDIVAKLANGEILPPHNFDHLLIGNWNG